jgi:hypothetical protein
MQLQQLACLAVSDFFQPPPPAAPEPEPPPTPPWFAAPRGVLPGVVALELMLARTDEVAVCVSRVAAYTTGFEFEIRTLAAPGRRDLDLDPMLFGPHRHRPHRAGVADGLPDELLRFGVQFADGSKATNTGGFHRDEDPPAGLVMHGGGGGGGGGDWRQSEWVWPLPPPGPVAFVCEWPAAGIPLSRAEIDAQVILDAAARAQAIFSDDRGPRESAARSSITLTSAQKPDRESAD